MKEQMKSAMEHIVKKYNGYVQLVCFLLTLIFGVILNLLDVQEKQSIIIELLCVISVEIIVGNLYQCVKYDQKNMVNIEIEKGYDKFSELLSDENAKRISDLFISGVTCSSVWPHIEKIKKLLKEKRTVRILISSDDAIDANVAICCENDSEKKRQRNKEDILNKINTLRIILMNNDETILKAYKEDRFQIRRTDVPFTLSYVGINLFDNNHNKKIQVLQNVAYQETRMCPTMFLNVSDNEDLFNYYFESLNKLWENAIPYEITDWV